MEPLFLTTNCFGDKPLAPPIPGLDFANVRAFRDIADG